MVPQAQSLGTSNVPLVCCWGGPPNANSPSRVSLASLPGLPGMTTDPSPSAHGRAYSLHSTTPVSRSYTAETIFTQPSWTRCSSTLLSETSWAATSLAFS